MKLFNLRHPPSILLRKPVRAVVNLVGLIQALVGLLQHVLDPGPEVLDLG